MGAAHTRTATDVQPTDVPVDAAEIADVLGLVASPATQSKARRASSAARSRSRCPRRRRTSARASTRSALALSVYDELEVSVRAQPGATVHVEGVGAGEVPTDESNLVVRSIAYTFAAYGQELPGLELRRPQPHPARPRDGSSGAAIVSGIMAAKGLLEGIVEIDSAGAARPGDRARRPPRQRRARRSSAGSRSPG